MDRWQECGGEPVVARDRAPLASDSDHGPYAKLPRMTRPFDPERSHDRRVSRPPSVRPSSATRRSSASRSIASSGPHRRCSAAARRRTTAHHRTRRSVRSVSVCPGALPTINKRAVEHVLLTGAAIEATAPAATRWDRKNYFYPDLPKGYQISQYDLPLASRGRLTFDTSDGPFTVAITRAHLEEDTAKLVHGTDDEGRQGQPRRLQPIRRAADGDRHRARHPDRRAGAAVCRGAPAAASLDRGLRRGHGARPDAGRGQRVASSARHRAVRDAGRGQEHELVPGRRSGRRRSRSSARPRCSMPASALVQETRGWSEERGETYRMRVKETSDDYRYFPEPDLPPLHLDAAWLARDRRRRCRNCPPPDARATGT